MTQLLLLRHGPTTWNAEERIQGRTDVPLSDAGRAAVAQWRLPDFARGWPLLASPLARAAETARMVGALAPDAPLATDERLMEARWGEWEGCRLEELRARHGPVLSDNEARGLDFRPPGGESPRDVQTRIRPLFDELAARGAATVAVAHLGVIRAVLAMALDWDMTGKIPVKLRPSTAHLFDLLPGGTPRLVTPNLTLLR